MRQILRRGPITILRATAYIAGLLILGVCVAGPAGAARGDQLPDTGMGAPLIAVIASLFVVIVGTTVLLAARRASRDD